jgi:tRNA threonylcarbamoyl adenosine modification protein YeaZ
MQFLAIFVNMNQISCKKMYTLILDTSSKIALIALVKGDNLCTCHFYVHENQLSKSFTPIIKNVLNSYPKIDRIAVGIGPGSYTGTRVGVTIARALCFGLNVPLGSFYSPLAYLPSCLGRFSFVLPHKFDQFLLIQGTQSSDSLDTSSIELIKKQNLYERLDDSDYVVSHQLLDQLKIPCYKPTVNPQALIPKLDKIFSTLAIKEIFYQHDPV